MKLLAYLWKIRNRRVPTQPRGEVAGAIAIVEARVYGARMRTLAPECRQRLEKYGYHLDASRDYWLKNDADKGALRISAREVERNGIGWLEAKLREFAAMPSR